MVDELQRDSDDSKEDEETVYHAVADFVARNEDGETVDFTNFVTENPELEEPLRRFLETDHNLQRLFGAPGTSSPVGETPTLAPAASADGNAPTLGPHLLEDRAPEEIEENFESVRYFGDYELLEEIARGGMGVVYKARQVNLNRVVALKMILAGQLASEEDVRRFYLEAEAAANLNHSGIVPIYEVGEQDGQHFFSMGYVEGTSLSALASEGPLPPREAASLARKIADAVQYAHQHGVVHRDLKPANVLLDRDGQPLITDFGLAKKTDASAELTTTGQILGTPGYMPPEQAAGDLERIGPVSDVYSIGAILYHLLTGRPPFQSANVLDTLMQVLDQEPVPVRQLNPQVPPDLETICLKCLQKDVARRYSSGEEVREELQRFLDGRPIEARPIGSPERAWRWCRRNPVVASLATAALAALIIGAVVSAVFGVRASLAARAERQARQDLEETLYLNQVWLAERYWQEGDTAALKRTLAACPKPLRRWEWYHLARQSRQGYTAIEAHEGSADCLALHPQGELFATGGADGRVRVWSLSDLTVQAILEVPSGSRAIDVEFHPEGALLAAGTEAGDVYVWQWAEGSLRHTFRHAKAVPDIAFFPDGRMLASKSWDQEIRIWDLEDERLRRTLPVGHYGNGLAVHPDGSMLAATAGTRGTSSGPQFFDTTTWRAGEPIAGHRWHIADLAFDPSGNYLATAGGDLSVRIWDVGRNSAHRTLTGHKRHVTSVAFQENLVASGSEDQTVRLWDPQGRGASRVLRGHEAAVRDVAIHPDGRYVLSSDAKGRVHLWDLKRGQGPFAWNTFQVMDMAFSPDDSQLAVATVQKSELLIFDRFRGKQLEALEGHQDGISAIAWHAAGLASGGQRGEVLLRRPETDPVILSGHDTRIIDLAFSPEGNWLATASDDAIMVWDVASGERIRVIERNQEEVAGQSLAISFLTRNRLLVGTGAGLEIIDVVTGKPVKSPAVARAVSAVVTEETPAGTVQVLAGHDNGEISVWVEENDEWTAASSFMAHAGHVRRMAILPGEDRLVSAGADGRVRLWTLPGASHLLDLEAHEAEVRGLDVTADGIIASGDFVGDVAIWDGRSDEEASVLSDLPGNPSATFTLAPEVQIVPKETRVARPQELSAWRKRRDSPRSLFNGDFHAGVAGWYREGSPPPFRVYSLEKSQMNAVTSASDRGDRDTGRLIQCFRVPEDAAELRFRLNGGRDPAQLFVALWVSAASRDEVEPRPFRWRQVGRATGKNSTVWETVRWDLQQIRGRVVMLELNDQSQVAWGFLNVAALQILSEQEVARQGRPDEGLRGSPSAAEGEAWLDAQQARRPLVNGDFRQGLEGWIEEASVPAFRVMEAPLLGERGVTSFHTLQDADEGRLFQAFHVPPDARSLRFRYMGGDSPAELYIALWAPRQADADQPPDEAEHWRLVGHVTGHNQLQWAEASWDLQSVRNQTVVLEIVDRLRVGWASISASQFEIEMADP